MAAIDTAGSTVTTLAPLPTDLVSSRHAAMAKLTRMKTAMTVITKTGTDVGMTARLKSV